MTGVIAVFNAGSSSLKFSFFHRDDLSLLHKGEIEKIAEGGHEKALKQALNEISQRKLELVVAGHRVVHGKDFSGPVRVTPNVMAQLKALIPLAPLHQPHNLSMIEALSATHPDLPQIACFDTAFHRTQEKLAEMFALPRKFYDEGIRRYGYHGLSYEYIASELPDHTKNARGRVVVAHLGNGASACAMKDLKSVATSMGFSTLDGLMMGTRCGTLDVGVALYMLGAKKLSLTQVEDILYHQSGLKGVSGLSNDMRELLASRSAAAGEAIELYCLMAAQHIAMLAVSLGGLDALVFTAGIGEHAVPVRERIIARLAWLGEFETLVIPTNEELMIARHCNILFP